MRGVRLLKKQYNAQSATFCLKGNWSAAIEQSAARLRNELTINFARGAYSGRQLTIRDESSSYQWLRDSMHGTNNLHLPNQLIQNNWIFKPFSSLWGNVCTQWLILTFSIWFLGLPDGWEKVSNSILRKIFKLSQHDKAIIQWIFLP